MRSYFLVLMTALMLLRCTNQPAQQVPSVDTTTVDSQVAPSPVTDQRSWTTKQDTFYAYGQGNDIIYDWHPENFDLLTEAQFAKLKANFPAPQSPDSSRVVMGDSTFTFRTSKAQMTYYHTPRIKYDGKAYETYDGYVEPYDLYVISSWYEGEILTGDMIMIDSSTNIGYGVTTVSDGPMSFPLVSKDSRFMLVYGSNYHFSNITILARAPLNTRTGSFREVISFSLNGIIKQIGWLDKNYIAFELGYQNYHDPKLNEVGYYRSKAPIDQLSWKKVENRTSDSE